MLLRLDTSRNELLVASTVLSVVACAVGVGSFITGAFGMNLDNVDTLQPISGLFYTVCIVCLALIGMLSAVVIVFFRRHGILPTHAFLGSQGMNTSTHITRSIHSG